MSTHLQSHVWGELYFMGCKLSYRKGVLSFHFIDEDTGEVAYTISCDLKTEKGRHIADEVRWSHAFPEDLFEKAEAYLRRWINADN